MTSVETKGNENRKKLKDKTKQKQTNKNKIQQATNETNKT